MKKYAEYLPLKLLNRISGAYPLAWEQMRYFHEHNGRDGLTRWADWCYAPMATALAVASYESAARTVGEQIGQVARAAEIAALAPWRLGKEVFCLDAELEQLLYSQADDVGIPSEVLLRIPYQAFYVQTNSLTFDGAPYHGFFVHLEQDANNGDRELRLLLLKDSCETLPIPIHIDDKTVYDSVQTLLAQARRAMSGNPEWKRRLIMPVAYIDRLSELTQKLLQIVFYLVAVNSDVAPNREQTVAMKRGAVIKDRYSEIRKWDVGFRVGAALRAHKAQTEQNADVSNDAGSAPASPRPHIRRAHWHHYWTGRRDLPEERKLILKWQAPTFVGTQEDPPVTLHEVR